MTKTFPTPPLKVGDAVILSDGGNQHSGVVRSISSWSFVLVETDDGHLYLDVVMNISAVSLERIVLLEPWVEVGDAERHLEIVEQISYFPKRADVHDVEGALRLCDPVSEIRRV